MTKDTMETMYVIATIFSVFVVLHFEARYFIVVSVVNRSRLPAVYRHLLHL